MLQVTDTTKPLAPPSKKAAPAAAKDVKAASTGGPEIVPADTQVCCGHMCHVTLSFNL